MTEKLKIENKHEKYLFLMLIQVHFLRNISGLVPHSHATSEFSEYTKTIALILCYLFITAEKTFEKYLRS